MPSCLVSSPSLSDLSLAGNLLSGPLPPLPRNCSLVSLDLSNNGPTASGSGISVREAAGLAAPEPASHSPAALDWVAQLYCADASF